MVYVSNWSRRNYYYHLGYAIILSGATIFFLIILYLSGSYDDYKYPPPLSDMFWGFLFIIFSFFALALYASYATYTEKYRDWLFFDYWGIRGYKKNILGNLVLENLKRTLHSLDRNIMWYDDFKMTFYHPSKTGGWMLNDSQLIVYFYQTKYGGNVVLWPNYVNSAENVKNEIYKSVKQTVDRFLLE